MISFQLLLLAFSVLSSTAASDLFQAEKRTSESQRLLDDITWIEPHRSFVVKLDTPGYPRWLLNKTTTLAPERTRSKDWYYAAYDQPSAVLLNFTLSSDNKTLYLNSQAILPLPDTMIPPKLAAYQVPANISRDEFSLLKQHHILSWAFYGTTIAYQRLTIDYDRLVWADPSSGPYQNHVPTLRFRLMGFGSYKQDDVLDDRLQRVVHVTLADQKHGSSDASDRSYLITEVALKESRRSYAYAGVLPNNVSRIDDCSARSWRCEDHGLYAEGEPWYRYMWRHKFDQQFGRIGSQRHEIMSTWDAVAEFFRDTWPIWVFTFVGFLGTVLVTYVVYGMIRYMRWIRLRRIQLLAEEDGLLGAPKDEEEDADFGYDDEPPSYEDSVKPLPPPPSPPPLPPRPFTPSLAVAVEQDLIVLNDAELDVERGA